MIYSTEHSRFLVSVFLFPRFSKNRKAARRPAGRLRAFVLVERNKEKNEGRDVQLRNPPRRCRFRLGTLHCFARWSQFCVNNRDRTLVIANVRRRFSHAVLVISRLFLQYTAITFNIPLREQASLDSSNLETKTFLFF